MVVYNHGESKRVPLIDRTGSEPKQIGWATVDKDGVLIGELEFDDPKFSGTGSFSIAKKEN